MRPRIYGERLRRAPQRMVTSTCVIGVKTIGQPFSYQYGEGGPAEKAKEIIMALNGMQLEGLRLGLFSGQQTRQSLPSTGEEMKGGELCVPFLSSSLWR